jgi:hypothetical protein
MVMELLRNTKGDLTTAALTGQVGNWGLGSSSRRRRRRGFSLARKGCCSYMEMGF